VTTDTTVNKQRTINATGFFIYGFICTFSGILVSNIIIAYALIDTSVDFATVQK